MDTFLNTCGIPKIKLDKFNRYISNNSNKNSPNQKLQPNVFSTEFYQTIKEKPPIFFEIILENRKVALN